MTTHGVFKVSLYDCYIDNIEDGVATIVLVDALPLLQAGSAASLVAARLGGTGVELYRHDNMNGTLYSCKVSGVLMEEVEKWLTLQ